MCGGVAALLLPLDGSCVRHRPMHIFGWGRGHIYVRPKARHAPAHARPPPSWQDQRTHCHASSFCAASDPAAACRGVSFDHEKGNSHAHHDRAAGTAHRQVRPRARAGGAAAAADCLTHPCCGCALLHSQTGLDAVGGGLCVGLSHAPPVHATYARPAHACQLSCRFCATCRRLSKELPPSPAPFRLRPDPGMRPRTRRPPRTT